MDKKENNRLTIDLRKDCDFNQRHIPSKYKYYIWLYFLLIPSLLAVSVYHCTKIVLIKKEVKSINNKNYEIKNKIKEIHQIESSLQSQISKANQLIHWQVDNIHGQKLLNTLFSDLPKDVLLDHFSFKRNENNHQVSLILDLKGNLLALHQEFEKVQSKLELMGFKLISLDQSEINEGMRLKCLCQYDISSKLHV